MAQISPPPPSVKFCFGGSNIILILDRNNTYKRENRKENYTPNLSNQLPVNWHIMANSSHLVLYVTYSRCYFRFLISFRSYICLRVDSCLFSRILPKNVFKNNCNHSRRKYYFTGNLFQPEKGKSYLVCCRNTKRLPVFQKH